MIHMNTGFAGINMKCTYDVNNTNTSKKLVMQKVGVCVVRYISYVGRIFSCGVGVIIHYYSEGFVNHGIRNKKGEDNFIR